jgi:hypothetical protein
MTGGAAQRETQLMTFGTVWAIYDPENSMNWNILVKNYRIHQNNVS